MQIIKDGIREYAMVWDGSSEALDFAQKLNGLFLEYMGMELPVVQESSDKRIVIGAGKEKLTGLFDFSVTVEGDTLRLCATDALSYSYLCEYLKREIFPKAQRGQLRLTADDNIVYSQSSLREKTFIRYYLEENETFPYGEHFAHKTYKNAKVTLPYRIYIPFNYDPQ